MMRHFDMKRYPRERGKKLYTTLGGRLFKEAIIRGGTTIRGNTVCYYADNEQRVFS